MQRYQINEVFYSIQGEGVRAGTANVFVRFTGCNLQCKADGEAGFDCDTEFRSGKPYTLPELELEILRAQVPDHDPTDGLGELRSKNQCSWLVLTGGEPALQVDKEFCEYFHARGYALAIETNGTTELPHREVQHGLTVTAEDLDGNVVSEKFTFSKEQPDWRKTLPVREALNQYLVDWICVSPKSADHTIKQVVAHEYKIVRNLTQALPVAPPVRAEHYLVSPTMSSVYMAGVVQTNPAVIRHCVNLCLANPSWRLSLQQHKFLGVR